MGHGFGGFGGFHGGGGFHMMGGFHPMGGGGFQLHYYHPGGQFAGGQLPLAHFGPMAMMNQFMPMGSMFGMTGQNTAGANPWMARRQAWEQQHRTQWQQTANGQYPNTQYPYTQQPGQQQYNPQAAYAGTPPAPPGTTAQTAQNQNPQLIQQHLAQVQTQIAGFEQEYRTSQDVNTWNQHWSQLVAQEAAFMRQNPQAGNTLRGRSINVGGTPERLWDIASQQAGVYGGYATTQQYTPAAAAQPSAAPAESTLPEIPASSPYANLLPSDYTAEAAPYVSGPATHPPGTATRPVNTPSKPSDAHNLGGHKAAYLDV